MMESIGTVLKRFMNKLGGKVTPVTGVFTTNKYTWLMDDIDSSDTIDLGFVEYVKEQEKLGVTEEDCLGDGYSDDGSGTYLIGFKENEKGEYEPNPESEYSAIVNGDLNTTQVVRSDYGILCRRCSPCYPNQGDAESKGDDYIAYSLPPDVIRDDNVENEKLADRVFKLDEKLFNMEG
jgi:hypothetical protein